MLAKGHCDNVEAVNSDFLTISPSLLEELKKSNEQVPKKLDATAGGHC